MGSSVHMRECYSGYFLLTSEKNNTVSVSRKFMTLSVICSGVTFVGLSMDTLARPVRCIWLIIIWVNMREYDKIRILQNRPTQVKPFTVSFWLRHSWATACASPSLLTWWERSIGIKTYGVYIISSYITLNTFPKGVLIFLESSVNS